MTLFSIILILFVALLLVLSVLAQSPKGGGLSAQFGGSSASRMVGSDRAVSLLEKITWGLACSLFVFTVGFNMFLGAQFAGGERGRSISPNVERALKQQNTDSEPAEVDVEKEDTAVDVQEVEVKVKKEGGK